MEQIIIVQILTVPILTVQILTVHISSGNRWVQRWWCPPQIWCSSIHCLWGVVFGNASPLETGRENVLNCQLCCELPDCVKISHAGAMWVHRGCEIMKHHFQSNQEGSGPKFFSAHLLLLECAIVEGSSVCLSHSWTMPTWFKVSKYISHHMIDGCFWFLEAIFHILEFRGSPWMRALKRYPRQKQKFNQ